VLELDSEREPLAPGPSGAGIKAEASEPLSVSVSAVDQDGGELPRLIK
jgi:hypothetical protein